MNGSNTFTAVAKDFLGNVATNVSVSYLPATNVCVYDLNGNLRTNGNRFLDYDDENQLIRVTVTNQFKKEFVYDGVNRLRIKREYSWNGSSWTQTNEIHFIYDGNVVIQERDANNLPKVTYTRGNDLSGSLQGAGGISGLLARSDNSQLLIGSSSAHAFYHSDGNGNVTMLINNLQAIVAKYLYDPFGNTLSLSGSLAAANIYRFSSKEWNDNIGLYYYLYRYYDPNLQRFLNHDPLAQKGGLNLYGYCGNNPIDGIDYLGLWPCWLQNLWNELFGPDDNIDNLFPNYNPFDLSNGNLNPFLDTGLPQVNLDYNQINQDLQNVNSLDYETISTVIGGLSVADDVAHGAVTIQNGSTISFDWEGQGVAAGSASANAVKYLNIAGSGLTVVGTVIDLDLALNHKIIWTQFGANTAVTGTSLYIGGPVGASLGAGYFAGGLINQYVPGVAPTAQAIIQPVTDFYYNNPNIEGNINFP